MLRAELKTARELGEQLLTQAQSTQSPARLTFAHHVLGATCFWLGELASTRAHSEQHSALYNHQQYRSRGVWEPVVRLSYAARILWLLGYPEQARKSGHKAITLAQELSHPSSLGFALDVTAMCHQLRREPQATQELAEAAARRVNMSFVLAA